MLPSRICLNSYSGVPSAFPCMYCCTPTVYSSAQGRASWPTKRFRGPWGTFSAMQRRWTRRGRSTFFHCCRKVIAQISSTRGMQQEKGLLFDERDDVFYRMKERGSGKTDEMAWRGNLRTSGRTTRRNVNFYFSPRLRTPLVTRQP